MIGSPHAHWRLTDSTNERARELALAGAPHGTLVTADEQSAGRGRQGRTWAAPPGTAVLMSLVVRDASALLPLAAAVAVCQAAQETADAACEIKWPNDVWTDRRKLAGILAEGRPQAGWAVLGIGVNVRVEEFPPELADTAVSLGAGSVEEVRGALVRRLDHWLAASDDDVLEAWSERDALRGKTVRWEGGEGVAAGVDHAGALLVDTAEGRVALDAGEVHLR